MLAYLDSDDDIPQHEDDKLNVRDNVKLAQVRLVVKQQNNNSKKVG